MRRRPYLAARVTLGLALVVAPGGCRSRPAEPNDTLIVEAAAVDAVADGTLLLPAAPVSTKFAVIGDSGRGSRPQHEVAATMARYRERFPFTFALMLGDNIYEGPATAEDYRRKFEEPYRPLLDAGVRFHAVLGNHDDPAQRFYPPFHMDGVPYYTFRPPGALPLVGPSVRFFALDSTNLDDSQFAWLARELAASDSEWKIAFLHHPLYTAGRYQLPARTVRRSLERVFVDHGVSVVFSGHEHFYQRSRLQRGVQYFVSGAAGSLRRGDARRSPFIARTFDDDYHFMLVEIVGDELHFQAVSRTGATVDAGVIRRRESEMDSEGLRRSGGSSRETAASTLPAGARR